MVDINVPNFITVGIISIAAVAFVRFVLKAAKVDTAII
jgi:hypothetical protein